MEVGRRRRMTRGTDRRPGQTTPFRPPPKPCHPMTISRGIRLADTQQPRNETSHAGADPVGGAVTDVMHFQEGPPISECLHRGDAGLQLGWAGAQLTNWSAQRSHTFPTQSSGCWKPSVPADIREMRDGHLAGSLCCLRRGTCSDPPRRWLGCR